MVGRCIASQLPRHQRQADHMTERQQFVQPIMSWKHSLHSLAHRIDAVDLKHLRYNIETDRSSRRIFASAKIMIS